MYEQERKQKDKSHSASKADLVFIKMRENAADWFKEALIHLHLSVKYK